MSILQIKMIYLQEYVRSRRVKRLSRTSIMFVSKSLQHFKLYIFKNGEQASRLIPNKMYVEKNATRTI